LMTLETVCRDTEACRATLSSVGLAVTGGTSLVAT